MMHSWGSEMRENVKSVAGDRQLFSEIVAADHDEAFAAAMAQE